MTPPRPRAVAALAALLLGLLALPAISSVARAEEPWLDEFEAVCSKTQDAMALSTDELKTLVERCDRLKPRIEALDPSRRKVYSRRLQLCRDLYQYVIEARSNAG